MDKFEIDKLMNSKSDQISVESGSGKSDVWPNFDKVIVDGEFCCYVRWKSCHFSAEMEVSCCDKWPQCPREVLPNCQMEGLRESNDYQFTWICYVIWIGFGSP